MARVTIGIPVYNGAVTLGDTLRSVFAQTYTDWELLLVDDGSTDQSLEIMRAVSECDPRVRVVSDGVNRGPAARANQISDLARGEYLARCDADDLMHPERLARQVQYLDEHPDCDLVDSAWYGITATNELCGIRGTEPIPRSEVFLWRPVLQHPAVMGRTEWFRRNRYDERYRRLDDSELWFRTAAGSVFGRIDEPLLFFRQHEQDDVPRMLHSHALRRQLLWTHGPARVGWPQTLFRVGEFYLRSLAYVVLGRAGALGWVRRRRCRRLTAQEEQDAKRALETILNTPVPGLDSPCSPREKSPVSRLRA